MKHSEGTITASDGLNLYRQTWEPEANFAGTVCLIHGLGEHSGRYPHVAAALTDAGFRVDAIDLRGHGRSGGPRGHSPSFEQTLDDIGLLLSKAIPGQPLFLYGHSLGGNLVLNYALRRPGGLTGVIATGPWLQLKEKQSGLKLTFGRLMAAIIPRLKMNNGLDANDLSHDPTVVQAYIDDPLVHSFISARQAIDTIDAAKYALEKCRQFRLPLLLIHGADDPITDPAGSEAFFATAGTGDKTLRIWPGLYHEVHNEPEKEGVLHLITSWLLEHC
jgi:alpha-beta hydrolase superfamily lysophospholipase